MTYVPGAHGGGGSGGDNGGGIDGGIGGGNGEEKLAVTTVAVGTANSVIPFPNHWLCSVSTEVSESVACALLAASVLFMTRSASTVRLPPVMVRMTSSTLGIRLLSTKTNASLSKLATSPAIEKLVRTTGT